MRACRILTAVLVLLYFQATYAANNFSMDVTGVWLAPGESGWGVNVVQQDQTLFVTLFVYRPDGTPTWFVGSDVRFSHNDDRGYAVFTGPLYEASGPWYGTGSFDEGMVTRTVVGDISFGSDTSLRGRIRYTANGVTVSKDLVPFSFVASGLGGRYLGNAGSFSCGTPFPTGKAYLMDVMHSRTNDVTISVDQGNLQCTLNGKFSQRGKIASVENGTYLCTNGDAGTFRIFNIEFGIDGLTGFVQAATGGSCGMSGPIAAARQY